MITIIVEVPDATCNHCPLWQSKYLAPTATIHTCPFRKNFVNNMWDSKTPVKACRNAGIKA